MVFGLIRKIRIGLEMPMTVVPAFPSTAAKRGPRKITSPLRSFITWLWTMRFLITFTVRNKTAQTLESQAAPIAV